jgi:DNA-binding HxlR family transcriptional regulator
LIPGASKKVLAQHLRRLEADGIVARKDLSDVVLHIEYELSATFHTVVCHVLDCLAESGVVYLSEISNHVDVE